VYKAFAMAQEAVNINEQWGMFVVSRSYCFRSWNNIKIGKEQCIGIKKQQF